MENINRLGLKKLSYVEAKSKNGGSIWAPDYGQILKACETAYRQLKHGIDDGFHQTD